MSQQSQFSLLKQKRFAPYFLTQFLGAFNDNVYKNALIILIAFQANNLLGSSDNSNYLINLSAALFILPFFLFSATAGQLADKFEKSRLIRQVKLLEIGIMALAIIGFYLQNLYFLMGILFLMGIQSTLFGPLKYGILPQHLTTEELIGGNGLVEMGTFLAILLGTIAGGVLIGISEIGHLIVSAIVISIAILGYISSLGIPTAPPVAPQLRINWNPVTETWRSLLFLYQHRLIFLSILAISWFWFFGALYLTQFPNYTRLTLQGNEQVATLLLTLLSLGIGIGSLFCEKLSGHKVEMGLVPFGAIGITLFSFDLSLIQIETVISGELRNAITFWQMPNGWRIMLDVLGVGIFGGFYIVPLYALVQQRTKPNHVSRVIASNNIISALFMVLSSITAIVLLTGFNFTIPELFLTVSIANIVVTGIIFLIVPEFLTRFWKWLLKRY